MEAVVSYLALLIAVLALIRATLDHRKNVRELHALQRSAAEAQRLLRQHADLANEVAHEIKNPITAILCSADALDLLLGNQIDEIHRKTLHYIREYGNYLLQIVSDFLDLSKAELGNVEARPKVFVIGEAVKPVLGLLESNANRKQIQIRIQCEDDALRTKVDPKHFKQILFNLVHNAIKFTPEKGEVRVVVKSDFPAPFVRVSVRDNGVGIPETALPDIFDPYVQCHREDSHFDTGAGLGLALCKNLVELAGGKITVSSAAGVGSVFEFTVPLYTLDEDAEPAGTILDSEAARGTYPLKGQRFLVVDENSGARGAIAQLIEAWGGLVDQVSQATAAVQALNTAEYDAVMIDDTTDGVQSYELARVLRHDLKEKDTTIIVASSRTIDPSLARSAGADSVIQKPLNGERLLRSLLHSGKYSVTH